MTAAIVLIAGVLITGQGLDRASAELAASRYGAGAVRVEAHPPVRLAAARVRDEVGALGHLVLEPADVRVLG